MCPDRPGNASESKERVPGGPTRRWRKVVSILVHGIGLVLFAVLVAYYWPGIRKTWAQIHWGAVVWSCALFPIVMALKVERFRLLTREVAGAMSYRYAYLVYLASYFIGVITPGRMGEFAKVHYLMRGGKASASQALRSTLIDRLFDMLCLLTVGSVGWVVLGLHNLEGMTHAKIIGFALTGAVVLTAPLWSRPPIRAIGRIRIFGMHFQRLMAWLDETLRAFYTPVGGMSALLTIAAYAIGFYQSSVIARSVGIEGISYFAMCVITAAINLAMLLPVSVSGFGTREASAIFLLGQMYQIPRDQAISFSLLSFGVFNVFGGLVGLACWLLMPLYRKRGFKESLTHIKAELEKSD